METKVVHYPTRGHYTALFKSPKATHWATFKDIDGNHLNFEHPEQAIQYCEEMMENARQRHNARTIWQSTPEKNI